METRGKRRQQEQEAAATVQIETRARKAARIAGQPQNLHKSPAQSKRQGPQPAKQTTPRPRAGRNRAAETAAQNNKPVEPENIAGSSSKAPESPDTKREAAKEPEAGPSSDAKKTKDSMDRQRRTKGDSGDGSAAGRDEDHDALGEGQELFGRNLNNASSALQGILRKLGAGFDDIMPTGGMSTSRLKGILQQLQSDDEALQLDGLNQLNELLAVSMEDSLSMFPVESLVPVLVQLLQSDHNPDIMLLAARALTFLADVLPASCSSIVRHGAVPAFCERLLNIEYIDLAEQSLQALEKISNEHSQACLRHGALLAVLSYLDFFQTGVQRVAVSTAAHMCRGLTTENIDAINSAVPILTGLLQYQDAKVVENASLALTRIAEALAHSPQHLEALCNQGLVTNAMQLVAVSEGGSMTSQLAVSTYYGLIRLLTTCASGSAAVARTLHEAGISATIRRLLSSSTLFSTAHSSPGSVLRSSDQLNEIVSLAHVLLPPLADSGTLILEDQPTVADVSGADAAAAAGQSGDIADRRRFLAEHPALLESYANDVLPLMLHVYNGTVVQQVKNKSLSTITKTLQYCPPAMLHGLLQDIPISAFIAALLASREPATLVVGVRLSELLMLKLPDVFTNMFLKEGAVHAMEQLSADAPSAPSSKAEKPKPKRTSTRLKGKDKGKEVKEGDKKGASPPEPSPIAAAIPPRTPGGPTLRQAAAIRAQRFISQYFGTTVGGQGHETEGLKLLKEICSDLGAPGAVERLLNVLRQDAGAEVSTFEFLSSGAVKQLRQYLLGEDLIGKADRSDRLLCRLRAFTDAVHKSGSTASLLALISKLQDGLAAAENLQVVSTPVTVSSSALRFGGGSFAGHRSFSGDGSSLSTGLAALTQPFKLRLSRSAHEDQLRDYGVNVVLIEPLATMAAVEDFLWPRVQRTAAERLAEKSREAAEKPEAHQPGSQAPEASGDAKRLEAKAASKGKTAALGAAADPAKEDAPLQWEASGGRQARRPASKVQPIPEARSGAQQRMTRAQASRAAQELLQQANVAVAAAAAAATAGIDGPAPMDTDGSDRGLEGTTPSDGPAEDDHMILLQGGEVEVEGGEDEDEDEDEEGIPYEDEDDEDMEEAELDGDQTMGLDRMHVHTVELGDATPGEEPSRSEAAAAARNAGPASTSAEPPSRAPSSAPAATGQTYAQAAAAGASAQPAPASSRRPGQSANHLRFYVNGHPLPSSYTIFQAIHEAQRVQQAADAGGDTDAATPLRRRRPWEETHVLQYSRFDNPLPESPASSRDDDADKPSTSGAADHGALADSPLSELLTMSLPEGLHVSVQAADVLLLLKVLEALNRLGKHLALYQDGQAGKMDRKAPSYPVSAREEFVNQKVAPKLAQQLKDVLAICGGNLPAWVKQLVFDCKFLFPFDLRRRYFYCTAPGLARALQHLQQQQTAEGATSSTADRELRVSRIQRSKVRISRKRILESAHKVMEMYASSRAVLELEYFNEAGTGLGPTLEFYTLLSHELQRKGMGMWRADDGNTEQAVGPVVAGKPDEGATIRVEAALPEKADNTKPQAYITAPQGLFPAPIHPSALDKAAKVVDRFKLLGRAMAKALQDNRLLDIPLSYIFYRAALERPLDLYNIREFDSALGSSLETLYAAHRTWLVGSKSLPMLVDGSPIEDLCLTFELPGHPEYELIAGGSEVAVSASNVGDYVEAVVNATLSDGIQGQMKAFRDGFGEALSLDTLKCFHEDELEAMLCGQGEKWTVEMLTDALKFDHGYTSSSTAIRHFLEILSELDAADQRRFLRFVTGSPRLPPGGLSALHPRLTVVRKHTSSSNEPAQLGSSAGSLPGSLPGGSLGRTTSMADGDLPSVMTCANYIKLPPYSSKSVMQARLLYAIQEGQGSFDLS